MARHRYQAGRDGAVKILPEAFGRDADRMTRFERDAQVLASLNRLTLILEAKDQLALGREDS